MNEPPIQVQPDGVDPQPHKTGTRWVDLILAGSAILISVISLGIAIAHGRIQQKMVAAASWPVLSLDSGNHDEKTGADVIAMTIHNNGAGPALLKSVAIYYRGKRYDGAYPLLIACCDWRYISTPAEMKMYPVTTSRLNRSVIASGADRLVLMVPKTALNSKIWTRLDRERFKMTFDACYCSVLGECWRSDLQGGEPTSVKACRKSVGFTR